MLNLLETEKISLDAKDLQAGEKTIKRRSLELAKLWYLLSKLHNKLNKQVAYCLTTFQASSLGDRVSFQWNDFTLRRFQTLFSFGLPELFTRLEVKCLSEC